jgi:hypothetical protein
MYGSGRSVLSARRNEAANYTLTVGITGTGVASAALGGAPAGDAKVKGTSYHTTGQVLRLQPMNCLLRT